MAGCLQTRSCSFVLLHRLALGSILLGFTGDSPFTPLDSQGQGPLPCSLPASGNKLFTLCSVLLVVLTGLPRFSLAPIIHTSPSHLRAFTWQFIYSWGGLGQSKPWAGSSALLMWLTKLPKVSQSILIKYAFLSIAFTWSLHWPLDYY